MSKTYGPRPQSFQLEDGERYYIGSEVGSYLKFHRGTLYKKYPQLWKKFATMEQKKRIQELQCTSTCINTNIMLVKASEIEEIFAGHEEKYRNAPASSTPNPVRNESSTSLKPSRSGTGAWLGQQVSSGSHHLESVPCSTPVAHAKGRMRIRDFGYCPDDVIDGFKKVLENSDQSEELIPIRLDMELDGVKLRDTFCYNKNDKIVTPEIFAEVICEDLELPIPTFHPAITQAIYQQIDAAGEAVPVDNQLTDQRAVLKLNIHVGNQSLVDQFEWDMSDPHNSPEQFAQKLCSELALGGEFVSAVAYSIRGQLSWNLRTYAFSESPLPVIENPYRNRPDVDQWGPFLETLTDAEIAKKMRNQDRNTRRIRRLANSTPYGI
ncbi:hypothetical protein L596_018932 [Steinernema carpocapsae]|uniref:SWI/SNF Subunit INI1 DNA binding domain-containing protein n=1 Tax=Steinernema carpocapsae TaxID=34508 RepID=A0A4V6XW51_STECR|nr:hypothetical protein L596_018932 [Steinernema carpocapsae]